MLIHINWHDWMIKINEWMILYAGHLLCIYFDGADVIMFHRSLFCPIWWIYGHCIILISFSVGFNQPYHFVTNHQSYLLIQMCNVDDILDVVITFYVIFHPLAYTTLTLTLTSQNMRSHPFCGVLLWLYFKACYKIIELAWVLNHDVAFLFPLNQSCLQRLIFQIKNHGSTMVQS